MYIIKKNKYCLILALFILSFYLGRGVCALAKQAAEVSETMSSTENSKIILVDAGHGGCR